MKLHPESSLQFCVQSSKVLTFDFASIRWSLPTHTRHPFVTHQEENYRIGALPKQERSRHSPLSWVPSLPSPSEPTDLPLSESFFLAASLKRGADFARSQLWSSRQLSTPTTLTTLPLLLPSPPQQERFDLMQSTLVVLVILLIGKTLSCSSFRQLSCSVLQSRYSHFLTLSHEDGYCRIRIVVPTPGF